MYLSEEDILSTPKVRRLNIINSVTGIKPGNLVGTRSGDGHPNLAIISSVVHLSSNPAMIGFIMRPQKDVKRDSYNNILETGYYTINHIHRSFIQNAHYTSAKFEKNVSEFEICGFTEDYLNEFHAPFVKESPLKIGLKYEDSIPIKSNDTTMVVGRIKHLHIPDEVVKESGYINLESLNVVGISGLNSYYELKKIDDFPYARTSELPHFEK